MRQLDIESASFWNTGLTRRRIPFGVVKFAINLMVCRVFLLIIPINAGKHITPKK